jgi:hypothetical protein
MNADRFCWTDFQPEPICPRESGWASEKWEVAKEIGCWGIDESLASSEVVGIGIQVGDVGTSSET